MRRPAAGRTGGLVAAALAVLILGPSCGRKEGGGKKQGSCQPDISRINPTTGDVSGGETVILETSCFKDDFTVEVPIVLLGRQTAAVTPIDDTTLSITTPPHAVPELVDVTVLSTGVAEVATISDGFSYVIASCTVLLVRPDQGSALGGQTIAIEGTNFDPLPMPPPAVEFGPSNPSPNVTVIDDSHLIVELPGATGPGLVDIIVTEPSGTCRLVAGFEYIVPSLCTLTVAIPHQGLQDQTTNVFLLGTGFDLPPLPAPIVEFGPGNFGTNVSVISSDRLVVDAPPAAASGLVDVIVTNQAGSCSLPGGFEYLPPLPPPACLISSVAPAFGPEAGDTDITILGNGFNFFTRVSFGSAEATRVMFRSETELGATSPAGLGTVDITVDIGGGTICIIPGAFSYLACTGATCQLQNASPNSGRVGDTVTISGNGFEVGAQVFFGNAPDLAQAAVIDETGVPGQLVVAVPPRPGADATVELQVINPSGSCCNRNNGFTYQGCFIESVTPELGPPGGDGTVLIKGEGFASPTGPIPEVWFGTELSPYVNPLSLTEIVALTPPSAGQTAVEVTVVYPTGETCAFCCYTYIAGCYIDSVVPDLGSTNGTYSLTITGWGFETVLSGGGCQPTSPRVRFDDTWADWDLYTFEPTGTRIGLVVPPSFSGGPVDVELINTLFGTRCTLVDGFNYVLPGAGPCDFVQIDPDEGWRGDMVTIRGDGFDDGTEVLFANFASPSVIYVSPQEIEVTVACPYGLDMTSGSAVVDVVVAPERNDPCVLQGGFTYFPPGCVDGNCPVTGVSPATGSVAGGNTVTVTGSSFCDPNDPAHPPGFIEVWFEASPGQATYVDDRTLSVVVPPSLTGPGPVNVIYMDATGCLSICSGCYTYN